MTRFPIALLLHMGVSISYLGRRFDSPDADDLSPGVV